MPDPGMLEDFLAGACVDAAVFALRPDYRALLLAADGIVPGPGDRDSDALLQAAQDLTRYAGPPRLVRAAGDEPFDTVAAGLAVTEHPEAGEVVWRDAAGVTCRRWNWRQARRTQLRENTTTALFILDALDPVTGQALHAAADDLTARLARLGPDVRSARRLIAADGPAPAEGD